MELNKQKASPEDRKKIIAKFARVKKIVKLMLMHLGSHPGKKPSDPKELATWEQNLVKLGRQAENNIYAKILAVSPDLPLNKFNVSTVLTNSNVCKQIQQEQRLPRNTPWEELQFFNS